MNHSVSSRGGCRGFTLLELVVAIGIFALVAAVAYGGLAAVLRLAGGTERQGNRLGAVQLAIARLERDLEQVVGRGIRDQYGDQQPALAASSGGTAMELTRAGRPNPLDAPRSVLQRVAWGTSGENLQRIAWPMLDNPTGAIAPEPEPILDAVTSFELRFLDNLDQWQMEWPAADRPTSNDLPRAVEINLTLADWGLIRRIVMVPGGGAAVAGDGTR